MQKGLIKSIMMFGKRVDKYSQLSYQAPFQRVRAMAAEEYPGEHPLVRGLWRWAMGYPLVMVWLVDGGLSLAVGRDLSLATEWLPKLFQSAIAAIPFIVLALCARVLVARHALQAEKGLRFATRVVAAASIAIWGAYYWDGMLAYRAQLPGGGNMGLGLLLLYSPVLLSLLIPFAYKLRLLR